CLRRWLLPRRQHGAASRKSCRILQQTRHVRTMVKEGKGAVKWTRLSCRSFAANAVRLQLHALAYNLGNFLRTLATPEPIKDWSLTTLKEKLIKIGAKGGEPRPLRRISDGGGRHAAGLVRGHLADDRGAATAALGVDRVERSRTMSSSQA